MSAVRKADKKALHFDSTTLNPYATWTDRDSTDHLAWYLDAITAYNQTLAAQAIGTAGMGIWRMGSEDPAIWRVIGKAGIDSSATLLSIIPPGYDAEMEGNGEILDLFASPDSGNRTVRIDPVTHLVVNEVIHKVGTPYIVNRYGSSDPHLIALTFDDGPDGKWTPMILDTLKSRGVTATFFLIGENAERHIAAHAPHRERRTPDRQPHVHASQPRLHERQAHEARARRHRAAARGGARTTHGILPPAVLRRRRADDARTSSCRRRSRRSAAT